LRTTLPSSKYRGSGDCPTRPTSVTVLILGRCSSKGVASISSSSSDSGVSSSFSCGGDVVVDTGGGCCSCCCVSPSSKKLPPLPSSPKNPPLVSLLLDAVDCSLLLLRIK